MVANRLSALLSAGKIRVRSMASTLRRFLVARRHRTLWTGGSIVLFVVAAVLGLFIYSSGRLAERYQKVADAGSVEKKIEDHRPANKLADGQRKDTGAGSVEKIEDERFVKNPGGQMAFAAVSDIWIMNADGSNPTRLTQDQGPPIEDTPTLSPSGEKVAFVQDIVVESWDKTTQTKVKTAAGRRVTVMDVGDRNQVELPVPEVPGDENPSVRDPSWSPDGRRVAFMAYSQPSYMPGCDERVFITNADGSGTPRVFPIPGLPGCPLWTPVWSPDGSQIAITGPGKDGFDNLYVMDASPAGATGRARQLTPDYLQGVREPYWSPDGSEIAFAGLHVGYHAPGKAYNAIFKIDVNSFEETRLTKGSDTEHSPTWSPDGENIAYIRDVTKPDYMASIYVVASNGSAPTLVRNLPASADVVDWRPQP
jgi:Tol biopolymer transport system component